MWEAKIKTERHLYVTQINDRKSYAVARLIVLRIQKSKRRIEGQFPTLLRLALNEMDFPEWLFISNFHSYERKRKGLEEVQNKWTSKSPKWPKMS